ncbi:hypothetical protein TH9_12120 [Thalassospira xiamenensis]|uniref:hypothetical protein n=1 Tax=Thalassospira xiamenensis TaxID=220697 RepID=UPI000DFDAA00|nr:hypothetical protein [Thalassospira xiamenensis]RCK32476.1 hypothetical protein TH9_12120 [Thalassospira xiamenensis]
MGIKMGHCIDQNGINWEAENYEKGKGKEPLICIKCNAKITHQSQHTRQLSDRAILIPAYFRLMPGEVHGRGCDFALEAKITEMVSDSHGIIESISEGKFLFRLVLLKGELEKIANSRDADNNNSINSVAKDFSQNQGKLLAYLNSALRVSKLRAICDDDSEIAKHVKIVVEGMKKVPWRDFFIEIDHYSDLFDKLIKRRVFEPKAINGVVASIKKIRNGALVVMNLEKLRYQPINDVGIGVEVSIFGPPSVFKDIKVGDEVIVVGRVLAREGEVIMLNNPMTQKFRSIKTNKLNMNILIKQQICKV